MNKTWHALRVVTIDYCPTRRMGVKPTPLSEDFGLIVDAATRIQAKALMVF
jgi:hypothetical protein